MSFETTTTFVQSPRGSHKAFFELGCSSCSLSSEFFLGLNIVQLQSLRHALTCVQVTVGGFLELGVVQRQALESGIEKEKDLLLTRICYPSSEIAPKVFCCPG